VVNAATGGTVSFKASGQTGISVAVGESAFVYYNGTDYVKLTSTSSGAAGGSTTQVQYNNAGVLAGSANLTFDGTTLVANNFTDSSLTAGRVTYAGTAGNLVDSANLTFDGTDFVLASGGLLDIDSTNAAVAMRIRQTTVGAGTEFNTTVTENTGVTFDSSDTAGATARSFIWTSASSERFRFGPSGQFGIAGANYGTAGQVLTSGGPSAAPTWAAGGGGGGSSTGANLYLAVNFGGF
jgi:hypothetical protein